MADYRGRPCKIASSSAKSASCSILYPQRPASLAGRADDVSLLFGRAWPFADSDIRCPSAIQLQVRSFKGALKESEMDSLA